MLNNKNSKSSSNSKSGTDSTSTPVSNPAVLTPTLKRRLICLVYDAFLLTAVVMLGMFAFLFATQMIDPAYTTHGPKIVLFFVAGIYLIHSWTGSGHTLAMKTWRIKLVMVGHARVPMTAALIRYLMAWGWVLPALVVCWALHWTSKGQVAGALAVNIIAWGLTVFLDRDRQFLHDRLAGTRLISLPKPVKKVKAG